MTGKRAAPKSSRGFRRSKPGTADASAPNPQAQPAAPGFDESFLPRAHSFPVQATPERSSSLVYAGAPAAALPTGPALSLDPPTPATPSGAFAPAGNPSVLPSGVAPLGSRSLARHEARQRSNRLRIVLAALLGLALVASSVWYVAHRGQAPKAKAPVVAGPDGVVLLQVTGADGAGAVALLGDQHGSAGAVVLLPTHLAVDAGGFGGMSLQKAATMPGSASADGVADALGIRVDGTWTLTVGGLAALVDRVGGIDADVDVEVTQGGVIKVPAGQQHLAGVAAAAYATYTVPGEPAQAQLARLDTVLEAVIGGFGDTASAATQQVAALGASSQSSLPIARLGAMLAHLHALDATDTLVYRSLPVHDLDSGNSSTYTVDTAGAAAAISDLTGSAAGNQQNAGGIHVLIRNGVGTPGLGATARAKLNKAGDVYVAGGNQLPFDKDETVILITEDTPDQRALGEKVAAALGVGASALRVSGEGQSIADVVVVLGTDYRP